MTNKCLILTKQKIIKTKTLSCRLSELYHEIYGAPYLATHSFNEKIQRIQIKMKRLFSVWFLCKWLELSRTRSKSILIINTIINYITIS